MVSLCRFPRNKRRSWRLCCRASAPRLLWMGLKAADRFLEGCFPPISRRLPGRGSASVFGWKWTPSAEARVRTLRRGHRKANMTSLPCEKAGRVPCEPARQDYRSSGGRPGFVWNDTWVWMAFFCFFFKGPTFFELNFPVKPRDWTLVTKFSSYESWQQRKLGRKRFSFPL
uniref:Uncharacterized protein n=1 Tax=Myotis myotis TaxID=51298 RepID=A0A7J7S2I9_MYOMY|nr:hypothetical protein mMyoMyo1_010024 [Myotis myotis]